MLQHEKRRKEAIGQLRMKDLVEDTRELLEDIRLEYLEAAERMRQHGYPEDAAWGERLIAGLVENVEELIERTGY